MVRWFSKDTVIILRSVERVHPDASLSAGLLDGNPVWDDEGKVIEGWTTDYGDEQEEAS